MTVEHTIPVYLGGPCHGLPLAPAELRQAEEFVYPPDPPVDPAAGYPPVREAPEPARYVRRTYQVGAVSAHAWMHGDFAGGLRDDEAAELVWTWLLEAAGVSS